MMAGPGLPPGPSAVPLPAPPPPPPACQLKVWREAKFWGPMDTYIADTKDLSLWMNDNISSIEIVSGVWQFFEDKDYLGASVNVGPGRYPNLGGFWNERISSFRCLRDGGPVSRDPWNDNPRPTPYAAD